MFLTVFLSVGLWHDPTAFFGRNHAARVTKPRLLWSTALVMRPNAGGPLEQTSSNCMGKDWVGYFCFKDLSLTSQYFLNCIKNVTAMTDFYKNLSMHTFSFCIYLFCGLIIVCIGPLSVDHPLIRPEAPICA